MILKKRHVLGLIIMIGLTFIGVDHFTKSRDSLSYIDEKDKVYEIKEYDDGPDLISVEMNNGETGYVYRDDFYDNANQPNNPDEAVEYMKTVEKNIKKYGYYKSIVAYKEDGKTKIGTFKIGGN